MLMMGTFHAQLSDNAAILTAHAIQALTFGGLTMAMGNAIGLFPTPEGNDSEMM
jgi:hypothetical protein